MAEYKGIKGYNVAQIATDPTANEGQTWYNTTTNLLKYDTVGAAAWSSAPLLNTHRPDCLDQAWGTPTATIVAGGWSAPVVTLVCEEYNGSSWTNLAAPSNLTDTRYTAATAPDGTTTAGLIFGGNPQSSPYAGNASESWNGSVWTETNALNTAVRCEGGAGTSTAAAKFGGYYTGSSVTTATEEFNGTSWSTIPAGTLNTGRAFAASCGSQTASLFVAGAPARNITEIYDGATWTTSPATLNSGRENCGAFGTTTSAICQGGNPPNNLVTEQFNGTAWTEIGDSSIGKGDAATSGGSTAGMGIGGSTSPYKYVEEWEASPAQVKTVTVS
mgnify:CR=1 FL=1